MVLRDNRPRHDEVSDAVQGWPVRVLHRTPRRTRLEMPRWSAAHREAVLTSLRRHPAVAEARVTVATGSLTVSHERDIRIERILADLQHAVDATPPDPSAISAVSVRRQFALPLISLAGAVLGLTPVAPVGTLMIAACMTPVVRRALRSLRRRRVTIDVLDSTAVALLLSTRDVLTAGVSVALIETGERIRSRASGRARRVLRGWMGADARGVRVVRAGSEPRIPISDVEVGDRAVVYAGETVPVDGIVVAGSAEIDNRTWTGEPLPVSVSHGARVLAGSSVSDGRLVIEVHAAGDETRAGRLAAALEDAIAANTRVSDMARRLADRFVIPLFLLGAGVFATTGDISRLISILIVDFGTGIRIAVPTAILTTMVAGARENIVFRNGCALEELAAVDTVVFDKTGTLTTGHPVVIDVQVEGGWTEGAALRLAAAAEGHLPHPLARALRRHARRVTADLPEPTHVHYQQGGGVVAEVDGHHVVVGAPALLHEQGIATPALEAGDSSVIMVAIDGAWVCRLRLRDRLKPDAQRTVSDLRRAGIDEIWLATGDRPAAARSIARLVGVDHWRAQMLPEDKVLLVRELREAGRRVAVVGDGINDAAALSQADVGVAVPQGADLARETADVVLGGDDLALLVRAIRLARGSMGLLRENIALVGVPNGLALGLATVGSLPPLAAAAANNGSTLIAALNALRPLRRKGVGRPMSR